MIDIRVLGSSSRGNGYIIDDGVTILLLEAGLPIKKIKEAVGFNVSKIAGCLVTHEHGDHAKSVKDLVKASIDVYASKGTLHALDLDSHRLRPIKSRQVLKIGSWTILVFDTQHDATEPLGFLLMNQEGEKLLFITDSYYCKYKFNGLTHIMVECNYSLEIVEENLATGRLHLAQKKRLIQSHFSLENVKEFFKANDLSKVQEIHLLHLSDSNSNAEQFKWEIAALTGLPVYVAEQ